MEIFSQNLALEIYLALSVFLIIHSLPNCRKLSNDETHFQLIKQCKRSTLKFVTLENTETLESCIALAKEWHGLALNYSPQSRRKKLQKKAFNKSLGTDYTDKRKQREPFLNTPEDYFNCHVLECPENSTLHSMVNDSRFDYFSLYEPMVSTNYSCIPGVGIFQLQLNASSYLNASLACQNRSISFGALAHIATESRTIGMSRQLREYNKQHRGDNLQTSTSLAYVGLHFNRSYMGSSDFFTAENVSLNCYNYRAWAPGYPRRVGYTVSNTSCVAITVHNTWITVDCEQKLPYYCEIYALRRSLSSDFDIGIIAADRCFEYSD